MRHYNLKLVAGFAVVAALFVAAYAHAGSANEERAALATARGFVRAKTCAVAVDTTAGGTAITCSLSNRSFINVCVPSTETDTLYLATSDATVTSTTHFVALAGGQCFGPLYLANDSTQSGTVVLKGLSSSGTISVKTLELGTSL